MKLRQCRVCGLSSLAEKLDLGLQPWANGFIASDGFATEKKYPLRLVRCESCSLVQLDYTVPKEVMFSNHTYVSGTTTALRQHFMSVARDVTTRYIRALNVPATVLDIGSNDGTNLLCFKDLGYEVLGVESSSNISKIANDRGVETLNTFYTESTLPNRHFGVINASGVFFHLEELHRVTEGIKRNLHPNGVFVCQFIYLGSIIENVAFDQIYHEHLLYYSLETLAKLLELYGLEIFDCRLADVHGGQMVAYIKHSKNSTLKTSDNYIASCRREMSLGLNTESILTNFAKDVFALRKKNLELFDRLAGRKVYGLGAPVKGNTLLNFFQLTSKNISKLLEKNPLRKGLYSPGAHIPVQMEDESDVPEYYYLLAWNFEAEIAENLKRKGLGGIPLIHPLRPQHE